VNLDMAGPAGVKFSSDGITSYSGGATILVKLDAADGKLKIYGENVGGRLYLHSDEDENIRSSGTKIIFAVGGADVLLLSTTEAHPETSGGLDLGKISKKFKDLFLSGNIGDASNLINHVYIGGRIYFGAAQQANVRYNGTDLAFQGVHAKFEGGIKAWDGSVGITQNWTVKVDDVVAVKSGIITGIT